jgi:hypothetical protein
VPWAMSYFLPSYKYIPTYWAPDSKRDIIDQLSGSDPNNPVENYWRKPSNPSDPGPWNWDDYFIYSYGPKVLGTFHNFRVQMWPEDLVNYPPFGNVKVSTPSYGKSGYMGINVYMGPEPLAVTPHLPLWKAKQKLNRGETIDITQEDREWIKKQFARTPMYITSPEDPWGQRVRKVAPGWLQHTSPISSDDIRKFICDDMREVKTQLEKAQHERWANKLPQRAKKQPTRDLFS